MGDRWAGREESECSMEKKEEEEKKSEEKLEGGPEYWWTLRALIK